MAPRDAPGVEVVQPGEEEKIKEVAEQFNRLQMLNFNEHMHCLRGTHLKTQGASLPPIDDFNLLTAVHSASSESSSSRTIYRLILPKACLPNPARMM